MRASRAHCSDVDRALSVNDDGLVAVAVAVIDHDAEFGVTS
jgi:hypothetical protein